jgi:hypothetical protein
MILSGTNQVIDFVTDREPSTLWSAEWVDLPATAGSAEGTVAAAATTTTIIPSPAAGIARQVIRMSIYNNGSELQGIAVRKTVGGTARQIHPFVSLAPGAALVYHNNLGFRFSDTGPRKIAEIYTGPDIGSLSSSPTFYSGNAAGALSLGAGTGGGIGQWMGKATRRLTSVTLRCNVTIAAVNVVYAEAWVATGTPRWGVAPGTLSQNQVMTFKGFVDIAASIVTTGLKSYTIPTTIDIEPGEDVWVGLAVSVSTTQASVRSSNALGEDLYCTVSNAMNGAGTIQRPSLCLGWPQQTIERSSTVAQPWFGISGI